MTDTFRAWLAERYRETLARLQQGGGEHAEIEHFAICDVIMKYDDARSVQGRHGRAEQALQMVEEMERVAVGGMDCIADECVFVNQCGCCTVKNVTSLARRRGILSPTKEVGEGGEE